MQFCVKYIYSEYKYNSKDNGPVEKHEIDRSVLQCIDPNRNEFIKRLDKTLNQTLIANSKSVG